MLFLFWCLLLTKSSRFTLALIPSGGIEIYFWLCFHGILMANTGYEHGGKT